MGQKTVLETEGKLVEICADIDLMVRLIYGDLLQKEPKAAEGFRRLIQAGFLDDGPIWSEKPETEGIKISGEGVAVLEMLRKKNQGGIQ